MEHLWYTKLLSTLDTILLGPRTKLPLEFSLSREETEARSIR